MDRVSRLIAYAAVFVMVVHCAAAQNTVHVVGDSMGWTVPPNNSVYSNWASTKTFRVGDILTFNFVSGRHDVLKVPQASYDACTQDNPIGAVITTGPANITLDTAGDHHFICTVGTHCANGQKLAITVVSSTPGGANPPATTPPATPTTPQPDACAPAPSSTPNAGGPTTAMTPRTGPPPPASASASFASSSWLILLSAATALIL